MAARAKTVLISGLGVGGPALAYWLKAGGFEPTLVEQAPALRTGGYVIDFWGLGYDIAERMGLRHEVDRLGYRMRELRVVGDCAERKAGFGMRVLNELTGGRFATLGRSDLSRLLFESLGGGVEVLFGDEIDTLRDEPDEVIVTFRHAARRAFDLVIGADGLHSRVRELAFGPVAEVEVPLGYGVAAFQVRGYRPRDEAVYVLYGQPGRMVGRFTLRDDRVLFLFVFAAERGGLPTSLAAQKAMLQVLYGSDRWECPQILDALAQADDVYFDSVSQIRMPSWSRGRVALIGDAAFCVSLAAGQGSALAMISAYVLAGELLRSEGRHPAAFAAYEERLRGFIGGKQAGAARFASAMAPKTRLGLAFRNAVINSFAIPGLARASFGREIIDGLPLPEYRWPAFHPPEA